MVQVGKSKLVLAKSCPNEYVGVSTSTEINCTDPSLVHL